jgi:hypothetical protein
MAFKFEDLKIWKEAVKFTCEVYNLTKKFPKSEQFGSILFINAVNKFLRCYMPFGIT